MLKFGRNPEAPGTMFGSIRADAEAAALEFCGTFVFLLFLLGSAHASTVAVVGKGAGEPPSPPSIPQLFYLCTSSALSLLFSAWLFYRATGGIFNPNVSTALFISGIIGPVRWVLCCIAQMVAAIAASGTVLALLPGALSFNTTLGNGVNKAQGVFIEMFVTATLCFAILMISAEKNRSTPFAPIGIGLTLFAATLFSTPYTGGSLNTARSFGPAVVSGFPSSNHWVYWVGPFLGSLLASALYGVLRDIEYWKFDPHQDSSNPTRSPHGPADTDHGAHPSHPSETTAGDHNEKGPQQV